MPVDLERLYDEHAQRLFAFVLNLVRDEADTRDVLQEVFCRFVRRPEALTRVVEVRAFLVRSAHHAAVDLIRRRESRERRHRGAGEEAGLFARVENPDENTFREALTSALGELPSEQRAVVHRNLWEGLTFEEIAGALDLSPNTAASRYRYGLDKLRERLRPLYEEIQDETRKP